MAPRLSQYRVNGNGDSLSSSRSRPKYRASFAASERATYSASVVLRATDVCFLDSQDTGDEPKMVM